MRHPKTLEYAIRFAVVSRREGIEPADLADLVTLARRAKRAMEQELCVKDAPDSGPATDAFEARAQALGLTVTWPGLWPELTRLSGYRVDLPALP